MYCWTYGSRNNILGLGGHTSVWNTPGGTLSDKTAMKEYPCLTQEMIYEALQEGKLQGKHGNMMGHPYVKLIRHEVTAFVRERFGQEYFHVEEKKKKLRSVKSQLRKIPGEIRVLEEKRDRLESEEKKLLEEIGDNTPSVKKKGSGRGRGRGRGIGRGRIASSSIVKNENVTSDEGSEHMENKSDSEKLLNAPSAKKKGSAQRGTRVGGRGGGRLHSSITSSTTTVKVETMSLDKASEDKENDSDSDQDLSLRSKRGKGRGGGRGRGSSSRGKRAKLEEL